MKTFVKWLEQKNPKLFSAIEIIKEPKRKKPEINHDGWKIVKEHAESQHTAE